MKRVLVTGASGFIGRHCLPKLAKLGYEVHAVTSKGTGTSSPSAIWHHVNLLDGDGLSKVVAKIKATSLLHLAWYAVPGKYWTAAENIDWTVATIKLAQAFAENGGSRIVTAGTCAQYDWRYGLYNEELCSFSPSTLYGTCKHSAQTVVLSIAKQWGITAAAGIIFFLYGSHEAPGRLVSSVVKALIEGRPAPCSHGNQVRDFLFVEDTAAALVALLESQASGPINIASGVAVRIKEVLEEIGSITGRRELIQLNALPATPNEPPIIVADTRNLQEATGWIPAYTLQQGLAKTVEWWRATLSQ